MIFNNMGTEVKVELNLGKTPSKVRNELIKDMLNFFKECQKEHSELHCTLFVKLQYKLSGLYGEFYRKNIIAFYCEDIISYENVGATVKCK